MVLAYLYSLLKRNLLYIKSIFQLWFNIKMDTDCMVSGCLQMVILGSSGILAILVRHKKIKKYLHLLDIALH